MEFNYLYATEPKQGDSFLCVTKSQEFLIFIWLTKKDQSLSQLGVNQCFWTQDPLIENLANHYSTVCEVRVVSAIYNF